jgi:hypothetical protein
MNFKQQLILKAIPGLLTLCATGLGFVGYKKLKKSISNDLRHDIQKDINKLETN